MKTRNLFLASIFVLMAIFVAIAFAQAKKTTNVETTLRPPDFETASALLAEGGCAACHAIPVIDGANGKLGPSLCIPASEFQNGEEGANLEFIVESIVDPAADVDDEYVPTVMPTNFGTTYSSVELTTLATFIATMNCE